jgi:hypothetical protein
MVRRHHLLYTALVAGLACGGTGEPTKPIRMTASAPSLSEEDNICGFNVTPDGSAVISVGSTRRYSASALYCTDWQWHPVNAVWSSNNTAVATVSPVFYGAADATGVGGGQAFIQATFAGRSDGNPLTVVASPPPPPQTTLSVSLSGPSTDVCIGVENTWTATASGGSPPYTYNWEVGYDWQPSHYTSMSYTFWSEGYYRVVAEVYDSANYRYAAYVDVHATGC